MRKIRWLVLKVGLLFIMLPLCIADKALAANFDCGKATTKVEKMICADAYLSKLDEEMAAVYKKGQLNEKQADSLRQDQKVWLKGRNTCADAACVRCSYESRLVALGVEITQKPAKWPERGDWTYRGNSGRNEPLCHALLRRLNRYARDQSLCHSCAVPVMLSYPEFKAPPWEELDIRQHEELVFKIKKYAQEGPYWLPGLKPWASDPHMVRKEAQFSDEHYRDDVKRFIEEGGRLRVWRTRLLNYYKGNNGLIPVPPGEEQTIVQMYLPNTTYRTERYCVGKPKSVNEFFEQTIAIVTPDLDGPDPKIDPGTFAIVHGQALLLYEGKPIVIRLEDVWRAGELMLDGICDYEFVEWRK